MASARRWPTRWPAEAAIWSCWTATAYAASKFAVRGFTEALRHELVDDGIGVTSVHPGGIRTRITENARIGSGVSHDEYAAGRAQFEKLLTIAPERAAEVILRGVERRRGRVLIGWSAKLPDLLARVMPASYNRVLVTGLNRGVARPALPAPGVPAQRPADALADPAREVA